MCEPATFTALGMSAAAAQTAATTMTVIGTISAIGGTVLSTVGAYKQSQAAKDRAKFEAAVSRNNAIIAERRAKSIEKEGVRQSQIKRLQAREIQDQQSLSLASSGTDITFGSNVDLLADTAELGELDAQVIRNNAARQAHSERVRGMNFSAQSELSSATADSISPGLTAGATLLEGIGTVASKWYRSSPRGGGSSVPRSGGGFSSPMVLK